MWGIPVCVIATVANCARTHTHTCTRTCTDTHTSTPTHTHTNTHTYTQTHTFAHSCAFSHTHVHPSPLTIIECLCISAFSPTSLSYSIFRLRGVQWEGGTHWEGVRWGGGYGGEGVQWGGEYGGEHWTMRSSHHVEVHSVQHRHASLSNTDMPRSAPPHTSTPQSPSHVSNH